MSAVISARHWAAAVQQTAPQSVTPVDSVVVESPLPGGVAAVTRFLLNNVPPWVQIGGLVVAAVVALLILRYLVRRRAAIRAWVASRGRGVSIALAAGALVLLVAVVGMGTATWNYTQHSNDFCSGCHVMNPAFQRFGAAENKHADLSCHDCHQQSLLASARQLYLWVAERPEDIGEHARVPNRVCETCHVTSDTARWQRIASTAGHRVHLESDSSALRNVQCVTCHGLEVHRFRPVSATCGQSGCHDQSETDIALGKMATQTSIHCTSCHAFTADVPALATRDSARGTLVPGEAQCLGCHEMRKVLSDFDPAKDPHGGKCGTCHNPHEQKTPQAAAQTCTTAACHANWREEPFHTGASHRRAAQRCLTCHVPHQAKVDASDCTGCHASVRSRGVARPPLPFDTSSALRRTSLLPTPAPHGSRRAGHPLDDASRRLISRLIGVRTITAHPNAAGNKTVRYDSDPDFADVAAGFVGGFPSAWPPPVAADTFSHARHARLACLVCHRPGDPRTRLTFERPRGCQICHHQAPASSRCASCHQPQEVAPPKPVTVAVTVAGRQPKPRPVDFLHERHAAKTCVQCHTVPVTLAAAPGVAECEDCHSDHHAEGRACTACHANADPKTSHTLASAHQRCDACHAQNTVALLVPTRTFCATCHVPQATKHYDEKQCTTCHFLAEPGAYRAKLTTAPR